MKQFEITEEQEWQLFELLEGNLPTEEATTLHKVIATDPALAYHYNLLKQTYSSAPELLFPNTNSLKKQATNKHLTLWLFSAAAAAIALFLIYQPIQNLNPIPKKSPVLANGIEKTKTTEQTTVDHNSINNQATGVKISPSNQNHTVRLNPRRTSKKQTAEFTHPLIIATNEFHSKTGNPDQNKVLTNSELGNNSSNNTSNLIAQQGALEPTKTGNETTQTNASNNNNMNGNETPIRPSLKQKKPINAATRKTGFALAKSFYNDGKTMIQKGHLPHVNIKARDKSNSLLPTIEMGLRLENNVIMASFNH
jgi:hypothetical protein